MFDIGWSELMIIGVVALIVVGPKDLPMMFRKVGNFVGKARGMARDFQSAMDQAADESGVKDIAASVKKAADIKDDLSVSGMSSKATEFAKKYGNTQSVADTKPAAKKPATKKMAAKKPAVKKTAAKKPAARVAKEVPTEKAAVKKTTTTKAKS
jgi:sec-independent protein translocase protein TatB